MVLHKAQGMGAPAITQFDISAAEFTAIHMSPQCDLSVLKFSLPEVENDLGSSLVMVYSNSLVSEILGASLTRRNLFLKCEITSVSGNMET